MTFGELLKEIRTNKGLSTRKLEELCKRKISAQYISNIENGNDMAPPYEKVELLAKILEVNFIELWEIAGMERIHKAMKKERINPAQALFLSETLEGRKTMAERMSKLITSTKIQKIAALALTVGLNIHVINIITHSISYQTLLIFEI